MAIVVDDQYAVRFTKELKPPLGSLERLERSCRFLEWHSNFKRHRYRRKRIEQVVTPRNSQPQVAKGHVTIERAVPYRRARTERLERHVVRGHARRRAFVVRRKAVGRHSSRDAWENAAHC